MEIDNYEIRNRAGEVVDITDGRQLISLFMEKVPDPITRSILFGTRVDDTDIEEIIESKLEELSSGAGLMCVMRRVINLVFVTVLCRWKQIGEKIKNENWARKEEKEYYFNSRFTKLFRSAVGMEDITFDLQIFALMELWVSLKKSVGRVAGRFANIFATSLFEDSIGLTLQSVRDAVKNASFTTLEMGKFNSEYCSRLCYRLLCSFPFLRTLKSTCPTSDDVESDRDFCLRYQLNYDEDVILYPNEFYENVHFVLTNRQLLTQAKRMLPKGKQTVVKLFLMVETSSFNNKYQYTYRSFDGENELRVELEKKSTSFDDSELEDASEVRKFLAFNYKNIRELALIICDSIKDQQLIKNKIYDVCKERDSKIIPAEITSADDKNIYWDNIITLLLVEMGPSDFLELILNTQEDTIFFNIIHNIGWRCEGDEKASLITESYEEEAKIIAQKCGRKTKALIKQMCALRIRKILEAMHFEKEEKSETNAYCESLSYKYENILVCVNTLKQYSHVKVVDVARSNADKRELIEIYTNIFKFLQIFYTAMDSYAEYFSKVKNSNQEEPNDEDKKYKRGAKERPEWFEFAKSAAQKKIEIEKQTLSQAFEGFCKLCSEYNTVTDVEANSSNKAKNLKFLITRNYICDVNKLRHFVDIEMSDGTKSTIFKMLEDFSEKYYTEKDYLNWLEYFLDLFFFLIYNEDYSEHGLYKQKGKLVDKDCDPIYPYLVTYYRENVDRDNLKKCTYRVPIPTGEGDQNLNEQGFIVNILTEKTYEPQPYFCIPLKYGSSENWWINPFLIPRGFVHRMESLIKEDKVK